jgi:hypothetical protein
LVTGQVFKTTLDVLKDQLENSMIAVAAIGKNGPAQYIENDYL